MGEGGKSEMAQLLQQIEAEYVAAQRGLHGLTEGTVRHDFITKRMENLGSCHEKLVTLIGRDKAIELLAETIWSPADHDAASRDAAPGGVSGVTPDFSFPPAAADSATKKSIHESLSEKIADE